jgi:hypothetical protein
LKSALVGDNPDQHKEREPASDLKHERAAPFHERCGCCFVFSPLTLGSISGFGVAETMVSTLDGQGIEKFRTLSRRTDV